MVDMLNARRSWVRIPVLAEIFTHESQLKCTCITLHWKLYMVHVREVKCTNLSRGSCNGVEYLKKKVFLMIL